MGIKFLLEADTVEELSAIACIFRDKPMIMDPAQLAAMAAEMKKVDDDARTAFLAAGGIPPAS